MPFNESWKKAGWVLLKKAGQDLGDDCPELVVISSLLLGADAFCNLEM